MATGFRIWRHNTAYIVYCRSTTGEGNFNWRFIFPFQYSPQERKVYVEEKEHFWSLDKTLQKFDPVFNIQAKDYDIFGPNDFLSKAVVTTTQ